MRTADAPTRRTRAAALALLASCLTAAGCAGGQEVTAESLRAARPRWARANVRDYDLEWASSGLSHARYAVTVRGGAVRGIETIAPDGRRGPARPEEPRYYGVDGLFLIIADELSRLDQPSPFGQPKGTKTVLRFTPDPTYGYPRRYQRDVMGAPASLAIDVIRFRPVAAGTEPPQRP